MPIDQAVALTAMVVMFAIALITGVWKYHWMLNSEDHLAPPYVDIAHRTALIYSFALLLVERLAALSSNSVALDLIGVSLLVAFFFTAVVTYVRLGFANTTDNQFKQRTFNTTIGMWALIAGEFSGFAILAFGALGAIWSST